MIIYLNKQKFEDILQDILMFQRYNMCGKEQKHMKKETRTVVYDDEITCYLRPLHEMVITGNSDFGKEENLLFLISELVQKYGQPFESCVPECPQEIEKACEFIQQHFNERFTFGAEQRQIPKLNV